VKLATTERRRLNGFKLTKLAMAEGLSKWERGFVHNASKRRRLSARDQKIFDLLVEKYLEAKAP
jgi:hypothetical protein